MRSLVSLRAAEIADAPALALLWAGELRGTDPHEHVADVEMLVKSAAVSAEERLVVAEHDGHVAGAVLLRLSTVTPLNLEPVVQAVSPHVDPAYRRRGVGRALMESAVTFAEETGATHVMTGVVAGSRDANRFMARLALGPHAMLRIAATPVLRARLVALSPVPSAGGRQLSRVLAARRSARRAQAAPPS